jgi:hypothetical protein
MVLQTLAYDTAFVRITKGVYAIRALMGGAPYEAVGKPQSAKKSKKPAVDAGIVAGLLGGADAFPVANGGGPSRLVEQEAESLTKVSPLLHTHTHLQSKFDKRDSLRQEKGYNREGFLCVLTIFTGKVCDV